MRAALSLPLLALLLAAPGAPARAEAGPVEEALAAFAGGQTALGERLLDRLRDGHLRRGVVRLPALADRLFAAALADRTHEALLAARADRLDPDPRRPLALAIHRARGGRPLDTLSAIAAAAALAADPAYRPLLFHLLLLLPLALALAGAVRVFARLHLYRRLLLHERAETGLPFHRLDPDRFARLPDRGAKDGLYAATALLVVCLFALLLVSVGPSGRLRRSVAIARELLSLDPGAVPLERLLAPGGVAPGTEALLVGLESLRRGEPAAARAAFAEVEPDSPFRTLAAVGLATADHLSGSFEAALARLRPVAFSRDLPDLWLALYGAAVAAGAEETARDAKERLAASPGGAERVIHLSTDFLAAGGVPPIPLAHDPAPLLDTAAARPGVAALFIAALGIVSGLLALLFARVSLAAEPSDAAPRVCANCGRISCERCRATVGLCPRCLEPLPGGLDPGALVRRQFRRDAPPALLLSTFLFGFIAHAAGRHAAGWSLGAACFLLALLGRATVALQAGALAPEPAALIADLSGWLGSAFLAAFLAQFAAGLIGPPAPPRRVDPALARYRPRAFR